MRQHIWIIWLLFIIGISSCSKTEEFYTDNEQDRDTDVITGDDYVYHLPVIFHVLYKDRAATNLDDKPIQYIPAYRLKEILDHVNELYEGELYNFGGDDVAKSQNIHIQLEMAIYDENGNKLSTPGVEYIKYNGAYPIDCNSFMKEKKKKNNKIIWDPNEYINVMVYNFEQTSSSSITLGISNMPYIAAGLPKIDGLESIGNKTTVSKTNLNHEHCISINSLYIYDESTRYTDKEHGNGKDGYIYTSTDVNTTLAHELGHYLGLYHVFAEKKTSDGSEPAESCDDTDYCTDTKSYNKPAYDKWRNEYMKAHEKDYSMKELIKRNNDAGDEWDSDNFMDYAISLSFRFTPEQKYRMRQVLYYSPLLPGPKKNRTAGSRSTDYEDEVLDLPIQLAERKVTPYITRISNTHQ